jgi:hypothetical protein
VANYKQLSSEARRAIEQIRFWDQVDKTPGHGPWGNCWIWIGKTEKKGYGRFTIGTTPHLAHRYSLALLGPIPAGLQACHDCDVTSCVRPDHLFAGTQEDNSYDQSIKKRTARMHGERNAQVTLTEEIVSQMRDEARGGKSVDDISFDREIPYGTCWKAVRGETWSYLPGAVPPSHRRVRDDGLTLEARAEIVVAFVHRDATRKELAAKYGTTPHRVSTLVRQAGL